jgi:hypothetical protein
MRVSQVRHEATTRNCRINLKRTGENHIGQRQARATVRLDRLFNSFAEIIKQGEKPFLLVRLRSVVSAPLLFEGFLDGYCLSQGLSFAVVGVFTLNNDLDSIKVLARSLSSGEIRATARLFDWIRLDDVVTAVVLPAVRLRRNKPSSIVCLLEFSGCGDYEAALFSFLLFLHCCAPICETQPERYTFGCLGHVAPAVWLNVLAGVDAPVRTAKLEAGAGFEPAMAPCKEAALANLAIPPLINLIFSILLFYRISHLSNRLWCQLYSRRIGKRHMSRWRFDGRNTRKARRHSLTQVFQGRPLKFRCVPLIKSLTFDHLFNCLAALDESLANRVNGREGVGLLAQVVALCGKCVPNRNRSHKPIHVLKYQTAGIRKAVFAQRGLKVHFLYFRFFVIAQGAKTLDHCSKLGKLIIDSCSLLQKRIALVLGRYKRLFIRISRHGTADYEAKGVLCQAL